VFIILGSVPRKMSKHRHASNEHRELRQKGKRGVK
jgi:hypothetical protein